MTTQYRQGDVLLVKAPDRNLTSATRVPREQGRIVLAHGEATGHAHAITAPDAELLEVDEGEWYLRLGAPADLVHEEHAAISLEPGLYRVIRQREYTTDIPEHVRD